MGHRTIRGKLLFTSKKPERMDKVRGWEGFTITQQADGTDVLLAHSEIDDAPNLLRDVSIAMRHADSSPIDCSVRLSLGNRFEGAGWMHFTDTYAECETYNRRDGRISQRHELQEPARFLGAHPLIADALMMRLYDLEQGPGKQIQSNVFTTSLDHRGATGPALIPVSFGIAYVGDEQITVGAGTFNARHFQLTDTAGSWDEEHPAYDVWCTADDDYLMLRAGCGGNMQTHYELVELDRG